MKYQKVINYIYSYEGNVYIFQDDDIIQLIHNFKIGFIISKNTDNPPLQSEIIAMCKDEIIHHEGNKYYIRDSNIIVINPKGITQIKIEKSFTFTYNNYALNISDKNIAKPIMLYGDINVDANSLTEAYEKVISQISMLYDVKRQNIRLIDDITYGEIM